MKINFNSALNTKHPAFQAVNQKYLKQAEKLYKERGNITTEWYEALRDDVCLFGDISKKDGVDTMNAARKYVTSGSWDFFNHVLDCIKKA